MNKKYKYEDVRELKERANVSMTMSATLAGLVFAAAVIFISLSSQNILSYILSIVLIFTTFIFIFGIIISHDIFANCSMENIEQHEIFIARVDGYNTIGLFLLFVSMCLLAFHIQLIVGLICTFLIIILIILWIKCFALHTPESKKKTK